MRYAYTEDVIGTTSNLSGLGKSGGCRSCGGGAKQAIQPRRPAMRGLGGFGQSGPFSAAVKKLQTGLRALATSVGNDDYHPGPADGLYGKNTHAAVLRVSRDFLEPQGLTTAECRSTCNTLALAAKSACADCLVTILRAYNGAQALPAAEETNVGVSLGAAVPDEPAGTPTPERLTDAEIAEIAGRYRAFLDAYVAKYGDGGVLDPAQIARREDVSMEEAERLAAARRGGTPVTPGTTTPGQPQLQKAGFSWWWVALFVGLGGAAWYAWNQGGGKRGRTSPSEVTEYAGFGRRRLPPKGGCGCGG